MGRDGKQTAEIGNRVFLPDDSGLYHHRHVDCQPIATEREKRNVRRVFDIYVLDGLQ
jgi:hypothetical protein